MRDNVWPLILFAAAAIIVIGGLAMLSQHYTLDNIKSRTVGDGQYGTARWATSKENTRSSVFRSRRKRGETASSVPKPRGWSLDLSENRLCRRNCICLAGPFTRRSQNGSGSAKQSMLWWTATTSTA